MAPVTVCRTCSTSASKRTACFKPHVAGLVCAARGKKFAMGRTGSFCMLAGRQAPCISLHWFSLKKGKLQKRAVQGNYATWGSPFGGFSEHVC